MKRSLPFLVVLVALAVGWSLYQRLSANGVAAKPAERPPAPVEVAAIERGPITLRRSFSGGLEAAAEVVVSPKVAGRLASLAVDIGDVVERGQLVATLDAAEYEQAVQQAEAELLVARASLSEAKSSLEIAERALRRAETLRGEGITTETELDAARTQALARRAHVEVAAANVTRAEAELETARIRLGYCGVHAEWDGGDAARVVAERHVDEGGTVSSNQALLTIVEIDPIIGVVQVPERDYARLAVGQAASLETDAFPGRVARGEIARIAPIFRRSTRQARIEIAVPNADESLKPGMFVRASLELGHEEDATIVPFDALTEREDGTGLFVVDAGGATVRWTRVRVGIREGALVQVEGDGLTGRVVVLGQELCDDGSRVRIVAGDTPPAQAPDANRGTR